MESKDDTPTYLKIDLEEAYIMGLESVVAVLKESIRLSPEEQREMLESLERMIPKQKPQ